MSTQNNNQVSKQQENIKSHVFSQQSSNADLLILNALMLFQNFSLGSVDLLETIIK